MSEADHETFFYMHIMKTAGTSLVSAMERNFTADAIYPDKELGQGRAEQYWTVEALRKALPDARERVQLYCGHFPYVVGELIGSPIVMTMLRDPVDRVVSHLRHCSRHFERYRGRSLAEIYEDPWHGPCLFTNYQVKQFALPLDDKLKGHIDLLEIDEANFDTALGRLHDVDHLGLVDGYEQFVDEVFSRHGWKRFDDRRLQTSPESDPGIPESLRRRIESENEADREFYTRAVELVDRRNRAGDR